MRNAVALLTVLSLAQVAAAQTVTQGYELLPGRLTTTTSGVALVIRAITPQPSEMMQKYDKRYVQGLGDMTGPRRKNTTGSACEFDTVKVSYQDQDRSTPEALKLVARSEGTTPGFADRTQTLFTQNLPAQPAGNGAAAWNITVQVANNGAFQTPCTETFFFGLEVPPLPANTTWPNDGIAVPASMYEGSPAQASDWPKGGWAADPLYDIVIGAGGGLFGGPPNNRMVFGYSLVPDSSVLQAGAAHVPTSAPHGADIGYGAAAIWPEVDPTTPRGQASHDGLAVRFTNNAGMPGAYGLFFSLSTASGSNLPIFRIPGLTGGVYLGIPNWFVTVGVINGTDTEVVLAPPKLLPRSLIGNSIYLQGYTSIGGVDNLTNLVGVEYK